MVVVVVVVAVVVVNQGGDEGSEHLEPRIVGAVEEDILPLMDYISTMGLSLRDFVALMGEKTDRGSQAALALTLTLTPQRRARIVNV